MEENNTKTNILGTEKPSALLRKFAVPSIIAMLVSSLYNIADQIFIGQGVGYLGNAATNVAFPLTSICIALSALIGIGSSSYFSLQLGAGNREGAAGSVGNAVFMMGFFGILYLILIQLFRKNMLIAFGATADILPYADSYTRITAFGMPLLIMTNGISNLARADGSPGYSMFCTLVGAIINVILDPIYIFVFDMGVAGAAYATVIGQVFSFLLALNYLRKFKTVTITKSSFIPKIKKCITIASLGMSNCLNHIALTFVQIVLNNSLTYYGLQSVYGQEIPLAGSGIVMKVNSILISVFVGLSQGSQPIVGYNYGATAYKRVRKTYRLAVTCALAISFVGFIGFQFFPKYIISIFGSGDRLYFEFAVKFMRTYLFMIPLTGVQIISSNFFSAIGKPIKGAALSLTRQVFFLIPLLLILPTFMGLDGIMTAAPIADFAAFVTSVIFIKYEFGKMKKLPSIGE